MKHNQPLGIFKQNILFPEEEKAQTQSVALLATSLLSNTFGSRVPLPHRAQQAATKWAHTFCAPLCAAEGGWLFPESGRSWA